MTLTPAPERPRRDAPEPPPGSELTAALWLLAVLIAVVELVWWAAERMYSV